MKYPLLWIFPVVVACLPAAVASEATTDDGLLAPPGVVSADFVFDDAP